MDNNFLLLISFSALISFTLNLFITPLLIILSHRYGFFDKVDERKIHTEDTSRLGGIGIFSSFLISIFLSPLLFSNITGYKLDSLKFDVQLSFFLSGIIIIFITGILDDFAEMRARKKLIGQILAAIMVIIGGALIQSIHIPFTAITIDLGYFSFPVTLFWIVGISNSINLIDGLDGLSSGISLIASTIFGIIFFLNGQFLFSLIIFILSGSLMGYLLYNFPPARIFMGDSGSLFLGFILAFLPLAALPESGTSLLLPTTMLAIPIMDVVAAIWRRIRDKKNVFSPDRYHMHHKLLSLNLSNRNILALVYGLCLLLGIAMILYCIRIHYSLIFLISTWFIIMFFFIILHFKKSECKQRH